MSAPHTPGPWWAHCEGGSFGVFAEDDGREIARLHDKKGNLPQSSFADMQYQYDGQHEANAHLIAAAPELLALAMRAQTMLPMVGHHPAVGRLISDLTDAIAKAKGGAA
ncbi:MAG: hypothetical protein KYX66_12360 [Blastomonas fulva]|uniref:hypothetical protein n=1 Tax=Blastomonas fulva TaxID=1550728 RepID=UPI0024E27355|nr:hypothetical protein [Blastomonas fulva]MDK2757518.1 hypothetical protein [Blastomonas fulva]